MQYYILNRCDIIDECEYSGVYFIQALFIVQAEKGTAV